MGDTDVTPQPGDGPRMDDVRVFTNQLLRDMRALEHMLETGLFETGKRRIGAEQEMFLVDSSWRPAPVATQVLETLRDPHFTPELARFNLELNIDPILFGGRCLSTMETTLLGLLERAREAAAGAGATVVLTGILPTLTTSNLELESMSPSLRFHQLNQALTTLRGRDYELSLKGIDELNLHHGSIMVEACNTSFQVHFQVAPEEFARLYNAAQAATAPVLAAAVNSALLFGKRLWRETRVGLFQQSIDTRRAMPHLREQVARVSFGRHWVRSSAIEIFHEDVARFRSVLSAPPGEDPFEAIKAGRAPLLEALRLHNSTVYRWNRVCYGISEGRPHLRIENRVLPSGPTLCDEVANAAFWFGLVSGLLEEYGDVTAHMPFESAHTNFFAAAQHGLNAQLEWFGGTVAPARRLILDVLLPLASQGLLTSGIDSTDVQHYLGIIEERVRSGRTGAQWQLESLAGMGTRSPLSERLSAITAATADRQRDNHPAHTWSPALLSEGGGWKQSYLTVEHCMDTDLVTVQEHEPVELVAHLMEWNHVRHVLVEDSSNRLIGIVSQHALLRLVGTYRPEQMEVPMPVSEVMLSDPITISPEASTLEAIRLMREHRMSCLPVVLNGHLVGKVTERQLMEIAGQLLEQQLRE